MKALNIFWGIFIVFAIFFINTCPAMYRPTSATARSQKGHRLMQKNTATQTEEEDFCTEGSGETVEMNSIADLFGSLSVDEATYIESLEGEEKELLQKAALLAQTKEEKTAYEIYNQLAIQYKNALALFKLGQMYEEEASDAFSLAKAHAYYKLASEKGFIAAIGKLLEVGEKLAALVNKPPSAEVLMMYQ